jgi:hypothetical protein
LNAKQTVQAAIDAANAGSTILIAAGTYFPSEPSGGASSTIPFDRTKTFRLGGDKNLRLIGGFNPDGSGQWNPGPLHDTSPTTFHTIFSGALGLVGERGDDALHVVTFAGATEVSRLDGIIVRDGNANGLAYHDSRGAAVLLRRPFGEEEATGDLDGVVQNCHITENDGRWGAGVAVAGGSLQDEGGHETDPPAAGAQDARGSIRTTLIDFNVIDWRGAGGINIDSARTEVAGCVIAQNSGLENGVGVQIRNPLPPGLAGERVRLLNCTIALNTVNVQEGGVGSGGIGLLVVDVSSQEDPPQLGSVLVESSIIARNEAWIPEWDPSYPSSQFEVQADPTVGNFLVEMNYTLWAGYAPGAPGAGDALGIGNINALDPQFVDEMPSSGIVADLHLRETSPCINLGQPTAAMLPIDLYDADRDGDTTEILCDADRSRRVRECIVEMGAYEGRDACLFDLDGEGGIGSADIAILLGLFGTACHCPACALDVDDDGLVGAAELAALLGDWGQCASGFPEGGEGGQMGQESSQQSGATSLAPAEVAAILGFGGGFDGVESLALWIASLEPAERVTIVTQLFAGGGA